MRERVLSAENFVPLPRDQVFPFFADARNLETLTPPWLSFRIVSPTPIAMEKGTRIEYRIRLRGIPLRWHSRIAAWEPPFRFVDEQLKGPYRLWIHEHGFESQSGGTLLRDRIRYAVHGGPLEPLVHRLLVLPDLRRIFAYRAARLRELLLGESPGALLGLPSPKLSFGGS